MTKPTQTAVYLGEELARYSFGDDHPFGPERYTSFKRKFERRGLEERTHRLPPVRADQPIIEYFHTHEYVERVRRQSVTGDGYLDYGDTPAFVGVFEAASYVVGSVLDAVERLLDRQYRNAFVPIAGLHHARRDSAAGFCVFNDCGVAVEALRRRHRVQRVAYVDIDAHHGDGVFYSFEEDPELFVADIHESGYYLYPGTGFAEETGRGPAEGTKLNIPLSPGADDRVFMEEWPKIETYLEDAKPEFILFQCGADSIADDPITHMRFSAAAHAHAATRLAELADELCEGRLVAMGGGGYNTANLATAWTAVVEALSGSRYTHHG